MTGSNPRGTSPPAALHRNAEPICDAIEAGLLSGAVTLAWRRGEILQVNELGHRDVAAKVPMTRNTLFRVASMTKPITTAAAMLLIEEGKLGLTDPVSRWLPELADLRVLADPLGPVDRTTPALRPITVDDLMTHRSGLAYGFSVRGPIAQAYAGLQFRQDADAWLATLAQLPLVHQPGERVTYSHATDVLGILVSRIDGKSLDRVLAERIFEPLGMADTGFWVTPEGRRRAATMYRLDSDNTLRDDAMGPASITAPPFCQGGSGLWTTADDYLRFARMLLADGTLDGDRVLSAESVRLMRTDRLTAQQKQQPFLGSPFWVGRGFGLGLSVVTDPDRSRALFGPGGLGTFGWPGAWGTWWHADPTLDLVLIYLIQNYPSQQVDAAAVAGGTSQAKLASALPRFVHRTYRAIER